MRGEHVDTLPRGSYRHGRLLQADEVGVFEIFGGDLPVVSPDREPMLGKWMGDCPHNKPVGEP